MVELYNAAPVHMILIGLLLLALAASGVFGLWHSAYTRRLVIVTTAILAIVAVMLAGLVWLRVEFFPVHL